MNFRSFANCWGTRRFVGEFSGLKILPQKPPSPQNKTPPKKPHPVKPSPGRVSRGGSVLGSGGRVRQKRSANQKCTHTGRADLAVSGRLRRFRARARGRGKKKPKTPRKKKRQNFKPRRFSNETPCNPRIAKSFKIHFCSPFSKYLASLFSFQSLGAICFRLPQNGAHRGRA